MLHARFGFLNISTGDLYREHLKNRTVLGRLIQKYLDQGALVPDEVAEATMEEWLFVTDPHKSIVCDGFPRTIRQAEFLEKYFAETSRTLDAVIYLRIPDDVVIKRLSERLVCQSCFTSFHSTFHPFTTCPYKQCKGEHLNRREEDQPESVEVRLRVFHQETEPLVEFYKKSAKLTTVEADRSIDLVSNAVAHVVQYQSTRGR